MELNVLYTANHKYVEIMATSLLSLIMNNSKLKLNFHIITSGFTETDYILINNIIKNNENVNVRYYKLEDYDISKYEIPDWKGTQISNARLFFQDIIDIDNLDKLLYLDSDTIVVGDLEGIKEFKKSINAVKETILNYRLKDLGVEKYYNSGVLLFDVPMWLEGDYERRLIETKETNTNARLLYPDQDLLNLALSEEIGDLPIEYNVVPHALAKMFNHKKYYYQDKRKYNPIVDIDEKVKNPIIYHSAGFAGIKPWMENNVNPLNDYFDYYLEMINPDLNKEKLKGARGILAKNPFLFYVTLFLKNNVLPESLVRSAEIKTLGRK